MNANIDCYSSGANFMSPCLHFSLCRKIRPVLLPLTKVSHFTRTWVSKGSHLNFQVKCVAIGRLYSHLTWQSASSMPFLKYSLRIWWLRMTHNFTDFHCLLVESFVNLFLVYTHLKMSRKIFTELEKNILINLVDKQEGFYYLGRCWNRHHHHHNHHRHHRLHHRHFRTVK